MNNALHFFLISLSGFLAASSGFWVYLRNRNIAKEANTRLLMGLAQDKIAHLGMKYIERGWVTADEYEHLRQYLYEPYIELGGNGMATRIMSAVEDLPLHANAVVAVTAGNNLLKGVDPNADGKS